MDKEKLNNLPSLEDLEQVDKEIKEEIDKLLNSDFYRDCSNLFSNNDDSKEA